MRSFPVALVIIKFFNPSSTGSVGLNRRENDITARPGMTPIYCIVLIPTVSSKRESARVKDPNFIALSKVIAQYAADVNFMVYMKVVRRWRKSAKMPGNTKDWDRTYKSYKSKPDHDKPPRFCSDTIPRAWWPSVEWNTLYSVRTAIEVNKVSYSIMSSMTSFATSVWLESWNHVSTFVVSDESIEEDFSPWIMMPASSNWRPFTATLVGGELERGNSDAMETMERDTKTWRNVKASMTRKCMFVFKL